MSAPRPPFVVEVRGCSDCPFRRIHDRWHSYGRVCSLTGRPMAPDVPGLVDSHCPLLDSAGVVELAKDARPR
jgi:hypothetical protein